MNIQEIHQAFDIELDKSLDYEFPYIQPEVKDYWLNKGQIELVKLLAYPSNPNIKGFEHGERRIDELGEITKESDWLTPTSLSEGVYEIDLPNDYFNLVRHRCKSSNKGSTKVYISEGNQSNHDEVDVLNKNPFWEPDVREPIYFVIGDKLRYETLDKFNILQTKVSYLKYPAKMQYGEAYSSPTVNVECEFSREDIQHLIIDKAVTMFLENIESQRYATKLNEFNNNN